MKEKKTDLIEKIRIFLREVNIEIKKVDWPSKNQTVHYTLLVISISLICALFLGGLDLIFIWVINSILK